jgi:NADH dehydrogenase [ubiquinone] 1 alpha subcomplex assembly factor 1
LFWGSLSTELPPKSKLNISGYAGVRSKERPLTLFHRPRFNVSNFRYLKITAKSDQRQYFVNIQADTVFPTYLWQHRILFTKPGEWQDILIPFRDFVLTANGFTQRNQIPLPVNAIKSIGFSILRQPGDFQLELKSIKAYNSNRTFGDVDLLAKDEYIDEYGIIQQLKPGQSKQKTLGRQFSIFPTNEQDKKWF